MLLLGLTKQQIIMITQPHIEMLAHLISELADSIVKKLTNDEIVHCHRLHHQIWYNGSESSSSSHVLTHPPHTQEGQVLHAVGVRVTVIPHLGSCSSLGSLPLQSSPDWSCVCCPYHCCLPHDKRGHYFR